MGDLVPSTVSDVSVVGNNYSTFPVPRWDEAITTGYEAPVSQTVDTFAWGTYYRALICA
jgi:hypothetical protein